MSHFSVLHPDSLSFLSLSPFSSPSPFPIPPPSQASAGPGLCSCNTHSHCFSSLSLSLPFDRHCSLLLRRRIVQTSRKHLVVPPAPTHTTTHSLLLLFPPSLFRSVFSFSTPVGRRQARLYRLDAQDCSLDGRLTAVVPLVASLSAHGGHAHADGPRRDEAWSHLGRCLFRIQQPELDTVLQWRQWARRVLLGKVQR